MTPCCLCHRSTTNPQCCNPCIGRILAHLTEVEHRTLTAPWELVVRGAAATPPDPTGTRHTNDGLPSLLVLAGPGSTAWHTDTTDIDSVVGVLQRYDLDWRITFHEPADKPATVTRCALYLRGRLHKAAQQLDPILVREFRDDIRTLHHQLLAAFKDGPQRADIPCMECHHWTLERVRPNGRIVEYVCSYCHTEYPGDRFWIAVQAHGAPV